MLKKILCVLMCAIFAMTTVSASSNYTYSDVKKTDWYYSVVQEANQLGILSEGNKFKPNDKITRGMVVTILYRLENSPMVTYNKKFKDVGNDLWYSDAIKWAAKNNIVSGYKNGKFGPDDYITREDLAIILHNYARYNALELSDNANLSKYSDNKKVDSYAKKAVGWAVKNKIMGDSKTLSPTSHATRAEGYKMIIQAHKVPYAYYQLNDAMVEGTFVNGVLQRVTKDNGPKKIIITDRCPENKRTVIDVDFSLKRNKSVVGFIEGDAYYISTCKKGEPVKFNPDSSKMFMDLTRVKSIKFENIDTSYVTDMSEMFVSYGFHKEDVNLDLEFSKFNTSRVKNMYAMFADFGGYAEDYVLDISNFDTSRVTNMQAMFYQYNLNCDSVELDLSNFDTSNVENMQAMFQSLGHFATSCKLDVSSFKTSRVKKVSGMFYSAIFEKCPIDISHFDLSNADCVDEMFPKSLRLNKN